MAFVVSPLSRALTVLQEQEYKLFYDFISLGLLVICYSFSKHLNFTLIEFSFFMSATQSLAYIAFGIVIYSRVFKNLKSLNK
jgi:hypothetical protein